MQRMQIENYFVPYRPRAAVPMSTRIVLLLVAVPLSIPCPCDAIEPKDLRVVAGIIDVSISIDTSFPPNVHLDVIGESPIRAKRGGELLRVRYDAAPKDGIQDFLLMATPGSGESARDTVATSYTWTSARRDAPWLVGIRIHGADGSVTKMLPLR